MGDEGGLFENLPDQRAPRSEGRGAPRVRVPERGQVDLHWAALDEMIAGDHPVRAVWSFVARLDLCPLYEAINAREGVPGHPPASPELMRALGLWRRSMGSAVRAVWTNCAGSILPIAGCAAACR